MKRWMENKLSRQKAYSKLINGKSDRFKPESKVATRCVAYSDQPKPEPATYDVSMVKQVKAHSRKPSHQRTYGDDRRTWDKGSLVSRCYGWSAYAQAGSVLIKRK